ADVFALGIIAWELFTGLPLYRGTDLKSILEAVRRTDPPRLDRINPAVPSEIVHAIATALNREPTRRGTASDLATACLRTAMLAGARPLALWLEELGPVTGMVQPEPMSVSAPPRRPSTTSTVHPPMQPPLRPSMTASLANVPVPMGDFGEGTPVFTIDKPADDAKSIDEPATVPARRSEPAVERDPQPRYDTAPPVPREPTISVTNMQRYLDPVAPPAPTEPFVRPSMTSLMFEEPTNHQFVPPAEVAADTSYDDLEVEPEALQADFQVAADEPIDDDLGAMTTGLPAERRRIVVVAGSLAGGSGDVLRAVTRSLGELAYQRGGVVIMLDDDALVVAFGLEVAGEDDVAVAMGWGLDASAMVRDVGEGRLVLRIGARAGVATVPDPNGAHVPQDAIDETRMLAREAAPDRPQFVGSAGRLTSALYELQEIPTPRRMTRAIRGRVMEVLGPRGFQERDAARLERRGKFVGRSVQLAELDVWFQRAIAADRRLVVLVQGAAGTGKSRLVAELIARHSETARIVTTAASPASRLAPFSLVIDLYQAALQLAPARGRAARRQVIDRLLYLMSRGGVSTPRARAVATDLDRAMELRDGVGLGAPEVADLRPRISAGLAAFRIAMRERERALVTIIEDIHHSDSASLEVLRHTLAVPAQGPELLVLTARPDGPVPPAVDAVISIGDLVGGELRALIADRLGDAATPFNIAAVLARGGGNPLFVEELAQAVRDAGPDGEQVPASARDVVIARMERLSPGARAALRFAAVIGGAVRARLLEELLGDDPIAGRTSGELEAPTQPARRPSGEEFRELELDELVRAGFLIRPEGVASGELHFARGLVREVVYDSMSARAQRDCNARVGRLLASRFFAGREEPPATIAEHLERGGELAGAAAFWLRAGRLGLTASDAGAAIAAFTRTLQLERELGATTRTSHARRREALAGREEAHRLLGDLGSDPHDLDELQRLCEGEPARLADVAIRRAQRMLRLGDYANASVATVVAEDHAAAANDDRLRGEALRVRGEILERLGQFDEALAVVGAARDLFHRRRSIHDEMAAMIGRGRIHLLRAHYEAARDAYRPVLALIDRTGDPWLERIVTNHVAVIEMCLGNFMRAMASAQRSLELCRRYGDRTREGDGLSVAGIILLEVGLHDQAAATFAEALAILTRTTSRWSRADCLIYAGVCELHRGNAGGLDLLDEALAEARTLGARYVEANALVSRAGAHLVRGDLVAAIADAAAGTSVAHAATLHGYEIQGLARHALALSRSGNSHDASILVHRALALLEQQRYLEGSEEEVFAACVEVLHTAGDAGRAAIVHERGHASARRKLEALTDPAWRMAYAAIPEVAALLR
ncbi:MAG: AAA family ATPase, partial [Kofleriaceae bacterium]